MNSTTDAQKNFIFVGELGAGDGTTDLLIRIVVWFETYFS